MDRMYGVAREHPANHRTDRRDRGAFSNENAFRIRRAVECEGAERAGEVEHRADAALEQIRDAGAGATGNAIEADLEWLAVLGARCNRVGPYARFTGKRDRN